MLAAGTRSGQHVGSIPRRSRIAAGSGLAAAIPEDARHRRAGWQRLPSPLQGSTRTPPRHPRRSNAGRPSGATERPSRRSSRGHRDRPAAQRPLGAGPWSARASIAGAAPGRAGRKRADGPGDRGRARADTPVPGRTVHRDLRRPLAQRPPRLLLAPLCQSGQRLTPPAAPWTMSRVEGGSGGPRAPMRRRWAYCETRRPPLVNPRVQRSR